MNKSCVIVWDLETIPDLEAFARMTGNVGQSAEDLAEELGDGFPPLPLHKIVCIGALIAERGAGGWLVRSIGAPSAGERTEAELIEAFAKRVGELRPTLVSFNGHGFDLPVLRYRAMANLVHAPGLNAIGYFRRYGEEAVDLCDVLSSFDARARIKLDALCKVLDLPGKPEGLDGGSVYQKVKDGRLSEVCGYCEADVVATYRVWLRYELFRGGLTRQEHQASEMALAAFLQDSGKPHLGRLLPNVVVPTELSAGTADETGCNRS